MLPSRRLPRRALAAVVAALVTAVGATVAGHSAAPAVHAQSAEPLPPMCGGWRADPVVAGMGPLENLAFDGRGGMLLSEQSAVDPAAGTVWTVRPDGSRTPLRERVPGPGGIVVRDGAAYVTTGNSAPSGLTGTPDGTIERIDLDTGRADTVARGLVMPNGLAPLSGGRWVVSRDLGSPTSMTVVGPDGDAAPFAPGITSTNGLAYDPASRALYVARTFDPVTTVERIPVDGSPTPPASYRFPGWGPANAADDLAVGSDGAVYVTHNVGARVVRIEPGTGATCVVADHLWLASSVRPGSGPGWDPHALYVTSLAGTVTALTRDG